MVLSTLRHSGHFPSLVAAFVYFDVSFMVWMLLGALGPYVAAELDLSSAQKGLMVAVPPLGGAAFRLLLGALADRHGYRRVGMLALGLTALPLAWGALAGGSYWQVLAIGALLGIAGASFAVALPLASRWYPPEHQGLALGIVGAGNSGTLVAALAGPRLAEHVGWHGVFGLALVPLALAFLVFTRLGREPARRGQPSRPLAVVGQAEAQRLAGLYAVTFGGFVGLVAYLPIYFVDRFSLAKVAAATLAAACAGSGSLLRPAGGLLADRVGGVTVLAGVFAVAAAASLGVAFAPNLGGTVALVAVLVAVLGLGNGAVFQIVPQRFPADVGSITGLVGAAGGVGGFLLPVALGSFRHLTGSFAPGFLLFGAVAVVARLALPTRRPAVRTDPHVEVAA